MSCVTTVSVSAVSAFIGLFAIILGIVSIIDRIHYPDELSRRYVKYGLKDSAHFDTSKTPIILIPGLDGAVSFFTDILPELTATQASVIVFHIPLLTKSLNESDYTFPYLATELRRLIVDELKINKFHIIGESFGGVIAQHFAFMYPQHLEKLVILSSLAKTELPPEVQWKLDYLFPIVNNFGKLFPSLGQFLFARIHVDDVCEESDPKFVKELFIKEATFAHFFSVMKRIKIVSKLDMIDDVRSIKAPTLILYGLDDHFTKEDSARLHSLIAGSQLQGIPGGHLAHVISPNIFAEHAISFFESTLTL